MLFKQETQTVDWMRTKQSYYKIQHGLYDFDPFTKKVWYYVTKLSNDSNMTNLHQAEHLISSTRSDRATLDLPTNQKKRYNRSRFDYRHALRVSPR